MQLLLQKIDLFGTSFQFTIFKKDTFQTVMGGLFTLACLGLIITFTAIFGRDFFYKINPTSTTQIVIPDETPNPTNLTNENLVVAFRISRKTNFLSNSKYLHPVLIHEAWGKKDDIEGFAGVFTNLNWTRCDNINSPVKPFTDNFNQSEFWCVDWSKHNLTFGGDPDGNIYHSFRLQINYCADQEDISTCADPTLLKNYLSDTTFVDILFPEFYYNANLKGEKSPIQIIYKFYEQQLKVGLSRYEYFYYRNVSLLDDQGWIFPDEKETYTFAVDSKERDYEIYEIEDYKKQSIPLYIGYFDFQIQKPSFYRSYMKIQDVAAQVAGILEVILIGFQILSDHYNSYKKKQYLFNEIFEYKLEGVEVK
jgi:hypothetical protein